MAPAIELARGSSFGKVRCTMAISSAQICIRMVCCFAFAIDSTAVPADIAPLRECLAFDIDWRFMKGAPADSEGQLSYEKLKPWLLASGAEFSLHLPLAPRPPGNPGGEVACTQPDFDDSGWRKLNLPHDWGIEGPFQQEYPGETGKLPWWGVGWYRKHFTVPASDEGKQ